MSKPTAVASTGQVGCGHYATLPGLIWVFFRPVLKAFEKKSFKTRNLRVKDRKVVLYGLKKLKSNKLGHENRVNSNFLPFMQLFLFSVRNVFREKPVHYWLMINNNNVFHSYRRNICV